MQTLVFGAVMAAILSAGASVAAARCPDLSLVLAIDSSGSIDNDEFRLQTLGYAAAFADPGVQRALRDAGTVDVAAVFWADAANPAMIVPWHRIDGPRDAAAFADAFLTVQRGIFGDTDIGDGLMAALDLLDAPGRCSTRDLVNLSGDGRASSWNRRSTSVALPVARARAEAMRVTVNALAILDSEPALADYYRTQLITGPGAFVMEVADFHSFGTAIARKLEREIAPQLSAALRDR